MSTTYNPDKVLIDDATVPPTLIGSDEYTKRRDSIRRTLRNFSIDEFCTHEAGHRIYFKQIGMTTEPIGPTIKYENGVWDYWVVSIAAPKLTNSQLVDYRFLVKFARAAVAGGVFLEVLRHVPRKDNGDPDDCEMFKVYMKKAQDLGSTHSYNNPPRRWTKARFKVAADLRTGVVSQVEIFLTTEEIKRKCFPGL